MRFVAVMQEATVVDEILAHLDRRGGNDPWDWTAQWGPPAACCGENGPEPSGNAAPSNLSAVATMQPNNDRVEACFGLLEGSDCNIGPSPGVTRALICRQCSDDRRTVPPVSGIHRWYILRNSHGTNSNGVVTGLTSGTNIKFTMRDAFDSMAPV